MRSIRFDTLNKVLLVAAILMLLLFRGAYGYVFFGVFITLFLIRAFSGDDYARARENSTFTSYFSRLKAKFTSKRGQRVRPVRPVHSGYDAGTDTSTSGRPQKPKADKDHRIYKCPSCKTYLRVPRGKGKILITCNKCGHKFNKKT